jgi:Icc-related predicted phosphoesterase
MLIHPVSDFHLDFHNISFFEDYINNIPKKVDTLIMAGDISNMNQIDSNIKMACEEFNDVIMVAGNHEYYNSNLDYVNDHLRYISQNITNFHFLNRNKITINDQSFIGCTLWFNDVPENYSYNHYLNDFHLIQEFDEWVYIENNKNNQYLKENTTQDDIVITHHAPSFKSVHERFKGSPLNHFFVSKEGEDIIKENNPKIWIHGHMHDPLDYMIKNTHVIANPIGYPFEGKDRTNIASKKIIKI